MNTTTAPASPSASAPDELQLAVTGMTCASCVNRVERALRKVPGVDEAEVNLALETATVRLRPGVDAQALIAAITKAGYEARALVAEDDRPPPPPPWSATGWPVLIAALLTLPLVAPMIGLLWGRTGCCQAGGSWRWRHRSSSGSARASTAPAGPRCVTAPATWTCSSRWAPARPTG